MKQHADLIRIIRQHSQPLEPIATGESPIIHRLAGIRTVLFDIYGTLLISASGDIGLDVGSQREAALEQSARALGLTLECSPEDGIAAFENTIREFHQRSRSAGIDYPEVDIVRIWKTTLASLISPDQLRHVDCERFAVEFEVRTNPVWPMPKMVETLDALRARGIRLGIISNAQFLTPLIFPAITGRTLNDLGFDPGLTYFSYEHGYAKPSLFLYRLAQREFRARSMADSDVLYVGNDMLNDILPSTQIGYRTALFAGDARSLRKRERDERVAAIQPDLVVTRLDQILDCFDD